MKFPVSLIFAPERVGGSCGPHHPEHDRGVDNAEAVKRPRQARGGGGSLEPI